MLLARVIGTVVGLGIVAGCGGSDDSSSFATPAAETIDAGATSDLAPPASAVGTLAPTEASTTTTPATTIEADPCLTELIEAEPAQSIDDTPIEVHGGIVDGWMVVDVIQDGQRIHRGCTDAFTADPAAVYALVSSGPNVTHLALVAPTGGLDHLLLPRVDEQGDISVAIFESDPSGRIDLPDGLINGESLDQLFANSEPQQTATIVLHSTAS